MKKHQVIKVQEGEGFWVKRPFPVQGNLQVDPFLLFDHFGPTAHKPGEAKGTPVHPHKGFELITYMISGDMHHKDSLGNDELACQGGGQWFYAGTGVLHKETPSEKMLQEGGTLEGIQLWINLKAEDKKKIPFYTNVEPDDMPLFESEDGTIKVIAGSYEGKKSIIQTTTPIAYLDVSLNATGAMDFSFPSHHTTLIYSLRGTTKVDAQAQNLSLGEYEMLEIKGNFKLNTDNPARVIILSGPAVQEPIERGGPFVMNTKAEIQQAFHDARSGKFGDPDF